MRKLKTKAEVIQERADRLAAKQRTKPKARYVTAGGRHSDPEKLAWLRTRKCIVAINRVWTLDGSMRQTLCTTGRVEAHHDRHHGSRATDKRTVPICEGHHRTAPDSLHVLGRAGFQAFHRFDMDAETTRYEQEWQDSK